VSIWEHRFVSLITDKEDETDFQTWDWYPAIQGAIDYCLSYQSQSAVNSAMYGAKTLYIPSGVYPIKTGLTATKYGSSTGSLATVLNIIGDGMTTSVIQPATDGITGLKATACKLNMSHIGFRAGADYCTAWELGDEDSWLPAVHCHWSCVGASGFARGLVGNLIFDSSIIDLFVQNITAREDEDDISSGVDIIAYSGPANGGTSGDGTGDDSNQIVFIRPTIETTSADNTIMFNAVGIGSSFPHHAINVFGGHIETHNLKAKLYNLKNIFNVNFNGTVFSQNGSAVDAMYRFGYIENCWNVNFANGRQVTTNRLSAYSSDDTLMIKVTGTSKNVRWINQHFIGPYNNLSAYNRGTSWLIDSSEATKGRRSYSLHNVTVGVYTNKQITPVVEIVNENVNSSSWAYTVDDSGNLILSYSSDSTDTVAPSERFGMSNDGILQTYGNIRLGYKNSTAGTRGIKGYTSGDGATSMGRLDIDSTGRIYLGAVQDAQVWIMGSTSFNPSVAATFSIGTSALYPANIYSQNSVTVVSDENYKSNIKTIADESEYQSLVAAIGTVPFSAWQLKSAIIQKGEDEARWHTGVIAQQVKEAIADAGLDWTRYGLITYESHSQVVTLGTDGYYYPVLNDGDCSDIPVNDEGYIDAIDGADSVTTSDDGTITYTRGIYMLRMEEFFLLRLAYIEGKFS